MGTIFKKTDITIKDSLLYTVICISFVTPSIFILYLFFEKKIGYSTCDKGQKGPDARNLLFLNILILVI
ncbi:hypothetical protein IKE_06245 [Bacillus cereus VD196]|uniref:Uncharacterized protein n=1 Tax=Bacillus cereus VD196 TaxID=1053243 RepID=A0A9W5PXU1_BACCE|nr:hypothetical protein IKG_06037 [Bacillus cereus VD200]EOO58630.1 hypothetical protein IKE_06245 [Bacillus cereus VD196]